MTTIPPDHDPAPTDPVPTQVAPDATGRPAAPSSSAARPWLLPVVTGVVGVVVGAGLVGGITGARAAAQERAERAALAAEAAAADAADAARAAILPDAAQACGVTGATGIVVADEGRSLTFDMQGDDDAGGADIGDIVCLFTELGMPSSVRSHIEQTTSVDGRQTQTWGDVDVSWSYHPDRGLDGVLTVADD